MNILEEIATRTKERIDEKKRLVPMEELANMVDDKRNASKERRDLRFPFEQALLKDGVSFICEVKKASPSKGVIAGDFPYVQIAKEYEAAGASAISVLTEPYYFQGRDEYLSEIAEEVSIPILRKDFTIDEYMLYEAKLLGADAVLLICAILSEERLVRYMDLAHRLGLSALVEVHDEEELEMALRADARIIGVNNRNLKTFQVDVSLSEKLGKRIPGDRIFVSESGIRTPQDIKRLRNARVNAVLIGETLMRSVDKKAELIKLDSVE